MEGDLKHHKKKYRKQNHFLVHTMLWSSTHRVFGSEQKPLHFDGWKLTKKFEAWKWADQRSISWWFPEVGMKPIKYFKPPTSCTAIWSTSSTPKGPEIFVVPIRPIGCAEPQGRVLPGLRSWFFYWKWWRCDGFFPSRLKQKWPSPFSACEVS